MSARAGLTRKQRRVLIRVLIAAGLLTVLGILCLTLVIPDDWRFRLPLFLLPYCVVGYDVLRKSAVNVAHGQMLDENFLMSVASIGAMAIGEYPEAVFVMLLYQVGELFQSIAVGRSRRSITALMDIRPEEARVERSGGEVTVSPEEVAVGELLVIRPGEKIPLDGVVEEGNSGLNTLSLTGESIPRDVGPGDEVVSGCVNISGLLRVRVTRPYGESTVAKILELVEHSSAAKSRAENAVTKFARVYTPAVVGLALLIAVIPSILTRDPARWVRSALTFLVVSCPCALVISVPLTYFAGIGAGSRKGILIKGANCLESLASVDTVAFDKTGTLTEGAFRVTSVHPVGGIDPVRLLSLAAAAERNSNHPIARSLAAADGGASDALPVGDVEEIAGQGVCATVSGHRVLVGNLRLMASAGIMPEQPGEVGTAVHVALDGEYAGYILISDVCKPGSAAAVAGLRSCGVRRTVMLTGDREEVARAVASEVGIGEYRAGLLPADKVAAVEKLLSEKRGTLIFVGDGTNDAPVLARADVGIAMGAFGSDAAIEAADVVLMDDDPADLPRLLALARRVRRIVRQNIAFALAVKLGFLILNLFLPNLWAATFADVGVAVLAILNASRAGK